MWFRYPGAGERGWVLEDVSFRSRRGGRSRSWARPGRASPRLVDLLVRAYDPDRGAIRLDGVDIRRARPRRAAPRGGLRAAGDLPLRRDAAGQRPARRAGRRPAGAGRGGEPARRGAARAAERLRHHARRAGHQPLRRTEAAHGDRPGAGAGPAGVRARRRAERGGRADRGPDPRGAAGRAQRADQHHRLPPPGRRAGRGLDPGAGRGADRGAGRARRPHRPRAAGTGSCCAGSSWRRSWRRRAWVGGRIALGLALVAALLASSRPCHPERRRGTCSHGLR